MHRKNELPKIIFDHKHFTPLWMLGKDSGLLADKHLFAIQKLSGYLPTEIYFYTQLLPDPLYIQAYGQQTLDLEKQSGTKNITNDKWTNRLETLSSQMYVKTKEMADEFFLKFYQREVDAIVFHPQEVISFLNNVQNVFSLIIPASFSTFPQCFSQVEEELAAKGSEDGLSVSHYGATFSYPFQLNKAILTYATALRKANATSIADYNKKHPRHLKQLSSIVARLGFLNWTELGGEVIDAKYLLDRVVKLLNDPKKFDDELKGLQDVEEKLRKRNVLLQKNKRKFGIPNRLGNISVMRLHMTTYVGCLQKYVSQFLSALANYYELPKETMNSYEFSELVKLIKSGARIDDKVVEKRKKGYLRIFRPNGSRIYSGEEARQQIQLVLKTRQREMEAIELQGAIASLPRERQRQIKGKAFVLKSPFHTDEQIKDFRKGEILVVVQTHPQLIPQMKQSLAVVTDEGGLTCHAAIVSRELHIPCIVGTKSASKVINTGDIIELDFHSGLVKLL